MASNWVSDILTPLSCRPCYSTNQ